VAAVVIGTFTFVPFPGGLAWAAGTRRIAAITIATSVGLLLVSQCYGGAPQIIGSVEL
jgi:hypothetical protein